MSRKLRELKTNIIGFGTKTSASSANVAEPSQEDLGYYTSSFKTVAVNDPESKMNVERVKKPAAMSPRRAGGDFRYDVKHWNDSSRAVVVTHQGNLERPPEVAIVQLRNANNHNGTVVSREPRSKSSIPQMMILDREKTVMGIGSVGLGSSNIPQHQEQQLLLNKAPSRIKSHVEDGATTRGPSGSRKQLRSSLYDMGFGRKDTYTRYEEIGSGAYSRVYRGSSMLLEDKEVALKEIQLDANEGAPCTAIREISLLRDLKHANIVTLHDIIFTKGNLTLVMEFVGPDLKRFMEARGFKLEMKLVKLLSVQIFRALEFCHAKHILHRDIKPHNMLINEKLELKLADFGLARAASIPTKTYSTEVVTLWYRPPDVLLGLNSYECEIDIWGAGCVVFEMMTGKPCFAGTMTNQLAFIFDRLGIPPPAYWPELHDMPVFRQALKDYCMEYVKRKYNNNHNQQQQQQQQQRRHSTSRGPAAPVPPDLARMDQEAEDLLIDALEKTKKNADYGIFSRLKRILENVQKVRVEEDAIDFLKNCLEPLPSRRTSAKKALQHDFFRHILPPNMTADQIKPQISLIMAHETFEQRKKGVLIQPVRQSSSSTSHSVSRVASSYSLGSPWVDLQTQPGPPNNTVMSTSMYDQQASGSFKNGQHHTSSKRRPLPPSLPMHAPSNGIAMMSIRKSSVGRSSGSNRLHSYYSQQHVPAQNTNF